MSKKKFIILTINHRQKVSDLSYINRVLVQGSDLEARPKRGTRDGFCEHDDELLVQ
jgi:hypothetical protein